MSCEVFSGGRKKIREPGWKKKKKQFSLWERTSIRKEPNKSCESKKKRPPHLTRPRKKKNRGIFYEKKRNQAAGFSITKGKKGDLEVPERGGRKKKKRTLLTSCDAGKKRERTRRDSLSFVRGGKKKEKKEKTASHFGEKGKAFLCLRKRESCSLEIRLLIPRGRNPCKSGHYRTRKDEPLSTPEKQGHVVGWKTDLPAVHRNKKKG